MTTPAVPDAPEHLSEEAAALWADVAELYELAPHQLEILRRACEASDRADEARRLLETEGLTLQDRFGQVKPHPAAAIERDSRAALSQLLRELALEPGAPEEYARPPRTGSVGTSRKGS